MDLKLRREDLLGRRVDLVLIDGLKPRIRDKISLSTETEGFRGDPEQVFRGGTNETPSRSLIAAVEGARLLLLNDRRRAFVLQVAS
jgi:hypothetical protein